MKLLGIILIGLVATKVAAMVCYQIIEDWLGIDLYSEAEDNLWFFFALLWVGLTLTFFNS